MEITRDSRSLGYAVLLYYTNECRLHHAVISADRLCQKCSHNLSGCDLVSEVFLVLFFSDFWRGKI